MQNGPWLSILERQTPGRAIGWSDVVVGHDFGFLSAPEIQAWAREQRFEGEAMARLAALEGEELSRFEETLWAACAEAEGKVPRPGGTRWAAAQDRWRLALLKDILATDLTPQALAVAVEMLYERVGCPEDMLGLLTPSRAWAKEAAVVDPAAVAAFLSRRERDEDHFARI